MTTIFAADNMPIAFNIDIELYSTQGAAPDGGAVLEAVETGLAGIWSALGLPARPALQVQVIPEPAGLFDFAIRLHGQYCPVPVYHPNHLLPPLEFRILSAIFHQRTLLITDEQLRELRHQCLAEMRTAAVWSSAPLSVWRALAELLLKNGFGLYRLSECFEHWSPDRSPEETFERLVENPETLALKFQVNPDLEDKTEWEAHLPGFYQEMYLELGILLPEITIETDKKLPRNTFRLGFNDLWLPVLPGLQAGEALYENPGALPEVFVPSRDRYFSKKPAGDNPLQAPELDDPRVYLLDWAKYWVGQLAGWYVNTGIVEGLLDKLEESNRSLIIMIREQWPAQRLCSLLRALLEERVSIRNLPEILDVLLRIDGPLAVDDTEYLLYFPPAGRVATLPPGVAPAPFSIEQVVSQVRAGLKYPITFPYLRDGLLPCYNIDPPLLRDLRDGFFQNCTPAASSVFYRLLLAIRDVTSAGYPRPVLLVPTGIRPAVSRLFRPYFPQMAVAGHEELPPFFIPQVLNTIQIGS